MTFSGKQSDINEALQWVVFGPDTDYAGTAASLTITTNDQGYLGTGGIKEDVDTISINVTAVPAFAASPTWTTFPGALDSTFDSDGMKTLSVSAGIDFIRQMKLLPDGKILAVGAVNNHFGIMRFNADLTLDTTFGTDGVTETNLGDGQTAWEVIAHPGGGWIVSGTSQIARYTENGILDTSFGTNGSVSNGHLNVGNTMAITVEGELLVGGSNHGEVWGGYASNLGGNSETWYRLSKYTLSGVLVEDWRIDQENERQHTRERGYFILPSAGRGFFPKDDGDIVFVGDIEGGRKSRSVRVNFKAAWNTGGTPTDIGDGTYIENSLLLPDGKILIVGQVVNGDFYAARFKQNGEPDSTFGTNGVVQIGILTSVTLASGRRCNPMERFC